MPAAPPKLSQTCRGGLGDCPRKPAAKPGYCPDLDLTEEHPCAPSLPQFFTPSNAELWSHCLPPAPPEHHGLFPAWEHPARQQDRPPSETTETIHKEGGMTHAELARLSARTYSLRASDPADFASAWETSIMPRLIDLLQRQCSCDFAIDVHNFPELSSEAVPRVIYITLSTDADTSALEQTIRSELGRVLPERFNPISLRFRKGGLRRSAWWGPEPGGKDHVCEPKNVAYSPTPVMGMSIGPMRTRDAASLGGFVRIGSVLYAMSAFHVFDEAIKACDWRVSHPAEPDLPMIVPADPRAKPYSIGTVAMGAPPGTFRPSLTFQGMTFQHDTTLVEMDWCVIGPVTTGKNFVSVPSFEMSRCVAVQNTTPVEGNTEVYAIARTSGYSLGFTSDVPGFG